MNPRTRFLFGMISTSFLGLGFILGWVGAPRVPAPIYIQVQESADYTQVEESAEADAVTYLVTAYCACEQCCGRWARHSPGITATGVRAVEGITVAADWSILPPGTVIEIEGYGLRIVQDSGSAIRGRRIDIFFTSHADALRFGVQKLKVREVGVWQGLNSTITRN